MPQLKSKQKAPPRRTALKRKTQAERTSLSDTRIHEAAMKLIARDGTHNLNLNEVSRMAGYSRSMASAKYGTKQALFADLISAAGQRWLTALSADIGESKGLAALRAWADSMANYFERNPSELRALYLLCYETVGSSERARSHVADTHVLHRARLEKWISDGLADGSIRIDVKPKEVAFHYVSLFYGLVYQWLVEPGQIDIVQALRNFKSEFKALKRVSSGAS